MPRPLMSRRTAQDFLRAAADLLRHFSRARIGRQRQAGALADDLHGHAALAGEFVLVAADDDEVGGKLLALLEGVGAFVVEQGPSERVLGDPQDAYTRELLTAIPHPPLPVH